MKFLNKIAIVTGASSGIGACVAQQFAFEGAKVVLVGRNTSNLKEVQKSLPSAAESLILSADIRDGDTAIVNRTIERFGHIDILVNSAGILKSGTIESTKVEDFDEVLDVNLRSIFKLTQRVIPHLEKTKGNIVNVSSITGYRSFPNALSYCVSKSALDQFTRCTALDLAPKGIRVNCVSPGTVTTNIHQRSGMNEQQYAAYIEKGKVTHALGRVGHVSEIANAILFLAGDSASFVTGCILLVDGGKHNLVSPVDDPSIM
ncbi:3-oxoacyl-[acyl-carrier-protein] reductase FabG [Pseudolycoriella hygida]|uniref:3-oxoacyl-[acyl-carrier-protein] reductase FabG n=1 Tax=Pseudolycoriella hygida TaxID=35572 RepID=A0A9Q0MKT4_9DIPT|nr:3-oxoacyl-[acyl-carrier-protein] reductase FabG [Pseudolycoriella hygida]